MATKIHRSTGNVFLDIGYPAHEAENMRVRAGLMLDIKKLIRSKRLTQTAAAKLLGVNQPRVSDLMCGKIDRFSIDALVEMLTRAGRRVEFATKAARRVA